MKFTIWKYTRVIGIAVLSFGLAINAECKASWSQRAVDTTKRVVMALPQAIQKHAALSMHAFASLKEDGTKWQLKLLLEDFYDLENERPLSYYIDEFIQIIRNNTEYFKHLLFTEALKGNTPNKDKVLEFILKRLELVKHSKNINYIKAMLYLPVRQWVRKHTKIPTDTRANNALVYHARFNEGK